MKIVSIVILLIHATIHLLGFIKGFGIKELKEFSIPVSKPMGAAWLLAAILLTGYGLSYSLNSKYSWIAGLIAVTLSQVLIIVFWKDAKFGTIPNLFILLLCLHTWSQNNFLDKVSAETAEILETNRVTSHILEENDIRELPFPVQNWLRKSGVLNKPQAQYAKITQVAEMQMKPGQSNWFSAKATQLTTLNTPAFIWTVDMKMNRFLSFQGRDKFQNGKGEMRIMLNALFNVVNERGEKLDEGSLQRFLGEMAWFPSLAVSPFIQWEPMNDSSARATMNFQGTIGSGEFYFNPDGEITRFQAMRFMGNETNAERRLWRMDVMEHNTFQGIKVPVKLRSTWKLDSGDWTWLKMEVLNIEYF